MDRVKYVARWVAMVPCALAAVLLAPHIVSVLFWIATLVRPEALDPESFLDRLFFEAVSNGAGGGARPSSSSAHISPRIDGSMPRMPLRPSAC